MLVCSFGEVDVAMMLTVLQSCGLQLRSDDAISMKVLLGFACTIATSNDVECDGPACACLAPLQAVLHQSQSCRYQCRVRAASMQDIASARCIGACLVVQPDATCYACQRARAARVAAKAQRPQHASITMQSAFMY